MASANACVSGRMPPSPGFVSGNDRGGLPETAARSASGSYSRRTARSAAAARRHAIVLVGCHRKRPERAAVKRLLEGDELARGSPRLCQYRRANFRQASTASVPLLQKNARGRPDRPASSSASWP